MTKKFWTDWRRRIGETKNIYLFGKIYNGNGSFAYYVGKWPSPLLDENDRLIKATFHNDAVDLVIERHTKVIDWHTRSLKHHVENEYKTLHRDEIASIKFIKY